MIGCNLTAVSNECLYFHNTDVFYSEHLIQLPKANTVKFP